MCCIVILFCSNDRAVIGSIKIFRPLEMRPQVVITAQQNLLLCDVEPSWKADVASTLAAAGIKVRAVCVCLCLGVGGKWGWGVQAIARRSSYGSHPRALSARTHQSLPGEDVSERDSIKAVPMVPPALTTPPPPQKIHKDAGHQRVGHN